MVDILNYDLSTQHINSVNSILRAGFISMSEGTVVTFDDIQLEVVNAINDTCHGDWYDQSHGKIFCANSTNSSMWELCEYGLDMTFSPQSLECCSGKK